jgi:hypothetical protein
VQGMAIARALLADASWASAPPQTRQAFLRQLADVLTAPEQVREAVFSVCTRFARFAFLLQFIR